MKQLIQLFFVLIIFFASCTSKQKPIVESATSGSDSYISLESVKNAETSWSKENMVIVHTIAEPDDMHPTNGTSSIRAELFLYTQMFLLQTDLRSQKLRSALCKSLPDVSTNGLEFTYELRDEPTWDNGDQLTVADIIFTAKASKCVLTNNPAMKPYWESLKDIVSDPNNKRKFTVIMKQPYIQNSAFWSDYPIMQSTYHDSSSIFSNYTLSQFNDSSFDASKHADLVHWAAEFNDARNGHDPTFLNGLGMYKITDWQAGQSITLSRKQNHWTKNSPHYYEASYPEKIIYKIVRDANAQLLEFKSQTLDASAYIGARALMDLQTDEQFNKNFYSRFIDTYGYVYLAMNMRPDGINHSLLFNDKKVRRAMALLTPSTTIIKIVNKGINKRTPGPVCFLKPDFNTELSLLPFDVTQAIALLNQAGWKDTDGDNILDKMINGVKIPFEFKLNYLTTQVEWKDMALLISEAMAKAGIKAITSPLDQGVMFTNARNHDFDMMLGSFANNPLPEDFTQVWHTQSWITNGTNYAGFGDANSDALIDSIKITLDDVRRNEMSKRLQAIIYDEQPFVFIYNSVRRNILHKRFDHAEMYYDRPGMLYNNLKLFSVSTKNEVSVN